MAKRRFDGILIDFYGTVCAGDREAVEDVCRRIVGECRLSVSPQELAVSWGERFFGVLEQSNGESFRTLYECVLRSLEATLERLNVADDPQPYLAQLEEYWLDPPIHLDALDFLRQVELPVCCVSNADTAPLTAAIREHGLRFDAVVTSEDARSYKPDPAIFRCGLEMLGVSADRAVHIGDSLHADVWGASKLGIATVWVCRENRIHDIGTASPGLTVAGLAGLSDILQNGHGGPQPGFP
ncbi:MAG: HAD family hydrolase [Planctomycetes bacterium]|nr:HAD family hydrolase [Planctomycetota bacterium]